GADFENVVQMMTDRLGAKPVPIHLPMFAGDQFQGIVDLVEMRALTFKDDSQGSTYEAHDIPRDLVKKAEKARFHLLEATAEFDEPLLDDYLDEKPYTADDMRRALRKGTLGGHIHPVLCGSAFKNKGVQKLLDAVVDFLPSPVEMPPVEGHTTDTFEHV